MDIRWIAAIVLSGCCFAAPARADDGLKVDAEQLPWPRFQTRIGVAAGAPLGADLSLSSSAVQGGRVLEDYYFSNGPLLGLSRGGFRATSGLLLNSRGPSLSVATVPRAAGGLAVSSQSAAGTSSIDLYGSDSGHAVPYVGVGYTGLSVKGGWGFTADVGLMAMNPGSGLRVGKVVSGTQSLDELVRDLQLTPVLQLGLSYAF